MEEGIDTVSVVAVVPCFRPDDAFPERLARVASQVERVIVIDDSGDAEGSRLFALRSPHITVFAHDSNRGIAAALNTGVRDALDGGADLVLTLDQDTLLPVDYVPRAIEVVQASSLNIGAVAAAEINGGGQMPYAVVDGIELIRIAIQSGMVFTAECFHECGLFDERLFIDVVDTEYCLRMRVHGLLLAVVPGTNLDHALGLSVPVRPSRLRPRRDLDATFDTHPVWRQYFISRNNVDVFLRYLRREPRWVGSSAKHEILSFWSAVVQRPGLGRYLLATGAGLVHGIVRRRGPIPAGLRRCLVGRDG